jgi:hypothetical protein
MIRPERTTSVKMSKAPTPKSPIAPLHPTGPSANRVRPGPITTFTNESLRPERIGSMRVNAGKPAGGK